MLHLREFAGEPVQSPEDVVRVGDPISVVVTGIDRGRRRVSLSRRQVPADPR
ncbi:S1 RNA-binding domain-containing protein [Streptomyces sp. NPDC057705]|uniref:S1 RNA-binding domain-containing protein n=1 Tax=Streptomyces sp. NPDC057705 TaxID=3346222 RepID=UPI00368D78C5